MGEGPGLPWRPARVFPTQGLATRRGSPGSRTRRPSPPVAPWCVASPGLEKLRGAADREWRGGHRAESAGAQRGNPGPRASAVLSNTLDRGGEPEARAGARRGVGGGGARAWAGVHAGRSEGAWAPRRGRVGRRTGERAQGHLKEARNSGSSERLWKARLPRRALGVRDTGFDPPPRRPPLDRHKWLRRRAPPPQGRVGTSTSRGSRLGLRGPTGSAHPPPQPRAPRAVASLPAAVETPPTTRRSGTGRAPATA